MAKVWSFNCEREKSLNGLTDVVTSIHWQCIDDADPENPGRVYGQFNCGAVDPDNFVAFEDLPSTFPKDCLGTGFVLEVENKVDEKIASISNPPAKVIGNPESW